MIGSNSGSLSGQDLSNYLVNFNSSAWANQANQQLQAALNQGLGYSQAYTQQALNSNQAYNNVAQNQMNTGFQQSQALNAPQQLATYNALDAYQNSLGLPTPTGGSYQLAANMNNSLATAPQQAPIYNNPQNPALGYKSGLLG